MKDSKEKANKFLISARDRMERLTEGMKRELLEEKDKIWKSMQDKT